MNREDIIRMAREAGFAEWYGTDSPEFLSLIERFAALVAAYEREACAAMVERGMGDWRLGKKVAAAIRARSVRDQGRHDAYMDVWSVMNRWGDGEYDRGFGGMPLFADPLDYPCPLDSDEEDVAKQSGSDFTRSDHFVCTLHDFKRFADLVVAHERESIIEILSRTEFTSLDHMPSEAALIIRLRGGP